MTDIWFDDATMAYTPGRIVQGNEYYPFGLQTANCWTRENTIGNNFLANGGTELNTTTQFYDTPFRGYDPALGRFAQVDLLADQYSSQSPYHFAYNNPVLYSDTGGLSGISSGNYDPWNPYGAGGRMGNDQDWDRGGYSGILDALKRLFPNATFGRGGSNGFYIKTWGIHYSTEGLKDQDGITTLATLLQRSIYVSGISLESFRTGLNPIVQAIHQGQEDFANDPRGAWFLALVSGGPAGGLGGVLRALGTAARVVTPMLARSSSALWQMSRPALSTLGKNLMQTGFRSASINASAQFVFKGFDLKKIDVADVGISALSGDAFITSGVLGGLVDFTAENRFQSVLNGKSIYQTSLDMALGVGFGGANFLGSRFLASSQIGGALGYTVDFTIQSYGEPFNSTLSNPR